MRFKTLCKKTFIVLILILSTLLLAAGNEHHEYDCDILIRGGMVFDGSLAPPVKADVAVAGGKIIKVAANIENIRAKQVINAAGLHVTPGFIDLHTHAEQGMFNPENRSCLNYLVQGVTTIVTGHCGSSGWPIFETFAEQAKRWSGSGIGPNVAMMVGHSYVRHLVMGYDNRKPTAAELAKMKALVKEAMEQGASGLSTGLIYRPGRFAKTGEIIDLVKVIVPYGGIYHSHIRNEGKYNVSAMKEAIAIGEKTGAAVNISHIKAIGARNWGKVKQACRLIEAAQRRGLQITADQYPFRFANLNPYTRLIPTKTWLGDAGDRVLQGDDMAGLFASLSHEQLKSLYTKLSSASVVSPRRFRQYIDQIPRKELTKLLIGALPGFELHGPGNDKERVLFLKRWHNPQEAERIRREMRVSISWRGGADNILVAKCVEENLEGKTLRQAAEIKGKSAVDTAVELHLMDTWAIILLMSEEDIEYAMKKDYVATGSDGLAPSFGIDLCHIRAYTTFLHKIKKYGLERKTVSLSHIIRSQTSLPARIMNWSDRGWIKEGYNADITVIDLEGIKTGSSVSNPHCHGRGVVYLLINGKIAIKEGEWTGSLPGKIIKLKR